MNRHVYFISFSGRHAPEEGGCKLKTYILFLQDTTLFL